MFIYLWLPWAFVVACRLSLVVVNGGYSLIEAHWLPMAVTFPVVEPRHLGTRASIIPAQSSGVVVLGLGCSTACEIFRAEDGTCVCCTDRWIPTHSIG